MVPARSSRHGISCSWHLSPSQAEIPLIPAVQISRASSLIVSEFELFWGGLELPAVLTPTTVELLTLGRHELPVCFRALPDGEDTEGAQLTTAAAVCFEDRPDAQRGRNFHAFQSAFSLPLDDSQVRCRHWEPFVGHLAPKGAEVGIDASGVRCRNATVVGQEHLLGEGKVGHRSAPLARRFLGVRGGLLAAPRCCRLRRRWRSDEPASRKG
ncbi:hypothetical protein ELG74_38445 [Rhizobium leguminosarum]|nr:hypothetical protein ELG74_38445 [Rhizobium leguminosarum]